MRLVLFALGILVGGMARADLALPIGLQTTYCNPVNIDYAYIPKTGRERLFPHRATADPVIVPYRGSYYLFATNQMGYWSSADLVDWSFHPRSFLNSGDTEDDIVAPAAWVMDDCLYVTGSDNRRTHPVFRSRDPLSNRWEKVIDRFPATGIDPCFFVDDDGRLYVYHNSSNTEPIYGEEIDRATWTIKGETKELLRLNPAQHGWERFGEAHDSTFLSPFIEGAWMTKYRKRYYLQYAAPGTEFNGYADGVYVGDTPLGPFTYQAHNPFSLAMGGFARGAGHGATFQSFSGQWWHVATQMLSVKNNFERRIGLWPAEFDSEGVLWSDQAYPDLPRDKATGKVKGWMILNWCKPATASSTLGAMSANFAVDEDIKTYWSANSGRPGEWLMSDLGNVCNVKAVQINYADEGAELYGPALGRYHRYLLEGSLDGRRWFAIADKTQNQRDVPHDYLEMQGSVRARFIRVVNRHVPTGKFALSGLRVFGNRGGQPPSLVQDFVCLRANVHDPGTKGGDPKNVWFKWKQDSSATGHVIRWGVAPGKLYSSVTTFNSSEYTLRTLDRLTPYYFQIEAFNENGIGPVTDPILVK